MAFDPSKHLITLKGKGEYLPVAQRLVWMRDLHPDWAIDTKIEVLDVQAGLAVFSATVADENGKLMARATKMETARDFPDYIEKAETGAVGRALAMCGFGTQFAPELEEGNRVADSPRGNGHGQPVEQRRDATAATAPVAHADAQRAGDAPAQIICAGPGCGRALTHGQTTISRGKWGVALCPACQRKQESGELFPAGAEAGES